ncbi:NAD-dependent epimerase/dehydratase family protein [Candidatus Beckwithbacteria bacterium]|nr:NAD-dependent epimerase/dehydratase family protein [Candidatus Beckwithbacteria bacterium]
MSQSLEKYQNKDKDLITILVGGGAGFVGSHLCQMLLEQNCYVYCVDNFLSAKEKNIKTCLANPRFKLIKHDLSEKNSLRIDRPLDYVFHLAGIEPYINGLNLDLPTLMVNSFGTRTLLNLAHKHQAKFLLGSSEDIFHEFHPGPKFTDYFQNRINEGETIFAQAKKFAEELVVEFAKEKNLDARIVRMGFVYGPRLNIQSGNLMVKMMAQAVFENRVFLPNDGMSIIYPTFISDVVFGMIKAMFSQSSKGRIYGLINPEPKTLLQIAYTLKDLLQVDLKFNFYQDPAISKDLKLKQEILQSQEALGWYARVDLEKGLQKTIEWLKTQTDIKNYLTQHQDKRLSSVKVAQITRPIVSIVEEKKEKPQVILNQNRIVNKTILEPQRLVEQSSNLNPPNFSIATHYQTEPVKVNLPNPVNSFNNLKKEILPSHFSSLTIQPAVINFPFWHKLKELFTPKIKSNFKNQEQPKNKVKIFKFFIASCLFFLVLVLFFSPLLIFRLSTSFSLSSLAEAEKYYEQHEFAVMQKKIEKTSQIWKKTNNLYALASWQNNLLNLNFSDEVLFYQNHMDEIALIFTKLNEVNNNLEQLHNIIFGKELGDSKQFLENINLELNTIMQTSSILKAENGSRVENLSLFQKIEEMRSKTEQGLIFAQIVPDIFAFNDKKKIMFLIQDSQELRPTGGFIDSVGIATIEKGKILDFEVKNVYQLDALLKGKVEPPEELVKYLKEKNWYLRDSNFDPDFSQSAYQALWFLDKEMGITADGVVAVNLDFFKKILSQTDGVFLPEFNETITADNFLSRVNQYAELNLFDGQNNNQKSFLQTFSEHFFEKLKVFPTNQRQNLVLQTVKAFEEKDLLMLLPDTNSAAVLAAQGWDGTLRETPNELLEFGKVNVADYLMIVDTNVGINKANYLVQRNLKHNIIIDEGGNVKVEAAVNLQNLASSQVWPNGTYKNYLRFYLPSQAKFNTLTLDDKKIFSSKIELEKIGTKQVVGTLVEIKPQENTTIKLTYMLSGKISLNNQSNYVFYLQKQPGIGAPNVTVKINYPQALKVAKLSSEATMQNNSLQFLATLNKDRVFAVSFSPKN